MTPDKSVSFCLDVPKSKKGSDFADSLQLLVPNISTGIELYGLRLRKIGFGTALFNQSFRLDLSAEIDQFNLLEMAGAAGLSMLKTQNEKQKHLLPDPAKLCRTFKAENLMTIIFLLKTPTPVPVIPIPVPVFYDRLYLGYSGIEGSRSELNLESPMPELNLIKGMKELSECVRFFTSRDKALPVPSHALFKAKKKQENDPLFRPLSIGPAYVELPRILGYEKKKGKKEDRENPSGNIWPAGVSYPGSDSHGSQHNQIHGLVCRGKQIFENSHHR